MMLFHKQSTENVQSCVLYDLSLSAVSDMYHQSSKYESILTLSVIIIIYNHGQKSLGEQCNIPFFVILGSLIKQCILFEINFSCSSPSPHPIQGWNSEKFWIHPSNIVWGVRGGVGPVWIGNAQKCKSVPRLLSMIVVGRKENYYQWNSFNRL